MKRIAIRVVPALALLVAVYAWVAPLVSGQASRMPSTKNGEWPMYTADLRGSKYSPLDQINAHQLQQARSRVALQDRQPRSASRDQARRHAASWSRACSMRPPARAAPSSRSTRRTGEMKWIYSMDEGERATRWAPRQLSGRGLSYWTDGKGDERVIYVTTGYRLVSLNAKTGQPVAGFGTNGVVDLKVGASSINGKQADLEKSEIGLHSTPTVVDDIDHRRLVDVRRPRLRLQHQRARARPARSTRAPASSCGAFDTASRRRGEFGYETWEERLVGLDRQQRRVDADHGRPGSRPRLPAGRDADHRRIRRQPPRRQPVRREPGRGRPEDRRAQVALPVRASPAVGSRHVVGAAADRHDHRRQAAQGRRRAVEAGLALLLRPHHRRADLADRRAAGAADDDAAREDGADAAVRRPSRRRTRARTSPRAT